MVVFTMGCRGKTIGLEAKRILEGRHPYRGVPLTCARSASVFGKRPRAARLEVVYLRLTVERLAQKPMTINRYLVVLDKVFGFAVFLADMSADS
jgi:hypothetical protein